MQAWSADNDAIFSYLPAASEGFERAMLPLDSLWRGRDSQKLGISPGTQGEES